jgi:solute carrier family 35, member E3
VEIFTIIYTLNLHHLVDGVSTMETLAVPSETSVMKVSGYMFLNFVSSVAIIWLNKWVFMSGFDFAISLTVVHFLFTFGGLWIAMSWGLFHREKTLSLIQILPISLAFCGFVVFNNLSLQYNSIGIYQLMKVMTTPTIVGIQYLVHGTRLPVYQAVALIPICIGVILATVTSVETNLWGTIFGIIGVIVTSFYQIWVKTEQERLSCSSELLLFYQSPLSAVMLTIMAPFMEDVSKMWNVSLTPECVLGIISSGIFALLVNLSIFLVISHSSPVSYNVLGHGKLCVILISGYTLFGESFNGKNIVGVILAVIGIVWYTHLKLSSSEMVKTVDEESTELIE